jgi:hypothetical protein
MVRDGVVETPSQVWKTCILTVIRIPLVTTNQNRGDYTTPCVLLSVLLQRYLQGWDPTHFRSNQFLWGFVLIFRNPPEHRLVQHIYCPKDKLLHRSYYFYE